ncbi:MAG: hypothetical protein ACI9T7_003707 [Oleiphilaceae bacterium]|jgi:hypothetical protein
MSYNNKHNNILAVKNEQIVHINDVSNGIDCCCTCITCGEILIAHKGAIRKNHFQHEPNSSCSNRAGGTGLSLESTYHWAFKMAIKNQERFNCPEYITQELSEILSLKTSFENIPYLILTNTVIEQIVNINGSSRRPDIQANIGPYKVAIEVTYKHNTTSQKKIELTNEGMEVLEVVLDKHQLPDERILIDLIRDKEWPKLYELLFEHSRVILPEKWIKLSDRLKEAANAKQFNQEIRNLHSKLRQLNEINNSLTLKNTDLNDKYNACLAKIDELEVMYAEGSSWRELLRDEKNLSHQLKSQIKCLLRLYPEAEAELARLEYAEEFND